MGYTTTFHGAFTVTPPLNQAQIDYLEAFNGSRRMKRDAAVADTLKDERRRAVGLPIGEEGAYYVGAAHDGQFGQGNDASVLEHNSPPAGQPELWCQWQPTADGKSIVWDGGEKFYDYPEWLEYIVEHFLIPWGCKIDGEISWQGEDSEDMGTLYAKDNRVEAVSSSISNAGPSWGK